MMSDIKPQALRAEALEALLIDKGLLTEGVVDDVITQYNERVGPMNGSLVVAKAWCDREFKNALLEDGSQAIEGFGFTGGEVDQLVVVENTDKVHNVVVCTLCSCYPWALLGLPPAWYKDPAYRSRIVREPRKVLKEFDLDLPEDMQVQVWDSSSEIRYLVLPQQPEGWVGLEETELADRVTRDSMIGVARL
jgi:nitrile hydratase